MSDASATLIVGVVTAGCSTIVAVAAIVFAARTNTSTLEAQRQIAADERTWHMQREVEQEISLWVSEHPLLGTDDPLRLIHPLTDAKTYDPGVPLLSRAKQYASQTVVDLLSALHAHGYEEIRMTEAVRTIEAHGLDFDGNVAGIFGWQDINQAQSDVNAHRKAWVTARALLEAALRRAPVEDQPSTNRSTH
jgi:hypothetical protein